MYIKSHPLRHISCFCVGLSWESLHLVCVRSHECISHTSTWVCLHTHTLSAHLQTCVRQIVFTREKRSVLLPLTSHIHAASLSLSLSHTQLLSRFLALSQCHSLRNTLSLLPPSIPPSLPPFMRQDSPALLHLIHSALIIQPHWSTRLLFFFSRSTDTCWPSGYLGKYS